MSFGWSVEEGTLTSLIGKVRLPRSLWSLAVTEGGSLRGFVRSRSNLVFSFCFWGKSEGGSPPLRIKAISSLMSFGWSIEEGLFTSSIGKGETATLPLVARSDRRGVIARECLLRPKQSRLFFLFLGKVRRGSVHLFELKQSRLYFTLYQSIVFFIPSSREYFGVKPNSLFAISPSRLIQCTLPFRA